MYCINLESTDPFFNLAIEEYLLKNREDDYLILGINIPSVIIGKHQSGHREVDTKFIFENNIPVIRRITGGGTVFHDLGNLNYTFIRNAEEGKQVDFRKYTQPVMDFLFSKGVMVNFEGKSDLKLEGFKISGNAEHVHRKRILHHGTLLFNSSLSLLRNSLRADTSHYTTRAVKSNPSPVTTLKDKLPGLADIQEFKSEMMTFFMSNLDGISEYQLSHEEIYGAQLLSASKYGTWEWNWAYGPEYQFHNTFKTGGELIYCQIFVKEGIISECEIYKTGELLNEGKKFIGCRHMVNDVLKILHEKAGVLTEQDIFNFF